MDRDFEITTGPDGLPTQTFNGKTYKKRINEDKEWFSEFHKKGIESAKQWHSSPEGNNCKAKALRARRKMGREGL